MSDEEKKNYEVVAGIVYMMLEEEAKAMAEAVREAEKNNPFKKKPNKRKNRPNQAPLKATIGDMMKAREAEE